MTYDRVDQVIPTGAGLVHVWLDGENSYRLTPMTAWLVVGSYERMAGGAERFLGHTVEAAFLDSRRGTLERLGVAALPTYVGTFSYASKADIEDAVARKWADVEREAAWRPPGADDEVRIEP